MACQNINRYAFEFCKKTGRKKIMACHKAGVMKLGDGLFIQTAS
jgi:isocitrate/isopropylmalate dehydrogenase